MLMPFGWVKKHTDRFVLRYNGTVQDKMTSGQGDELVLKLRFTLKFTKKSGL